VLHVVLSDLNADFVFDRKLTEMFIISNSSGIFDNVASCSSDEGDIFTDHLKPLEQTSKMTRYMELCAIKQDTKDLI